MTTLKKAAEALALAAPAAVEAEMLPGDAERMVDAVLRAIREPGDVAMSIGRGVPLQISPLRANHCAGLMHVRFFYDTRPDDIYRAMIDSILNGEG